MRFDKIARVVFVLNVSVFCCMGVHNRLDMMWLCNSKDAL